MNFAEVEQVVAKLRQDLAAGRLTEEQFKARLRELMVEDEQSNWWMVGYETGGWYRHDGTDWVPDQPPGRAAPRAAPQPMVQPLARAKPQPRPYWGTTVLVLGSIITFYVELSTSSIGPIALASGILTTAITYVVWRPKPGWAWGTAVLVLGVLLTFATASFGAHSLRLEGVEEAIGLGGLILTIVFTVKAWRGE